MTWGISGHAKKGFKRTVWVGGGNQGRDRRVRETLLGLWRIEDYTAEKTRTHQTGGTVDKCTTYEEKMQKKLGKPRGNRR